MSEHLRSQVSHWATREMPALETCSSESVHRGSSAGYEYLDELVTDQIMSSFVD